jgi:hypothetical protein
MLRSMNRDLDEGSTDGKYKKVINARGGVVDSATYDDRKSLSDVWYGIHEADLKRRPDGKIVSTPNYRPTPHAEGSLGFVA